MMATDIHATESGLVPYRLTVRQFERMIDAGIFPEGVHVELLGGVIVETMTKNDPHDYTVGRLGDALRGLVPAGWLVREEKSLRLGRSWRPEPDVVVVRGRHDDYRVRTPTAADVGLLFEVADTTYTKDRGSKWRRYAAVGVPVYGIIHFAARRVEIYRQPSGQGRAASYGEVAIYGDDAEVPVILEGNEVSRIAVRDLLP